MVVVDELPNNGAVTPALMEFINAMALRFTKSAYQH